MTFSAANFVLREVSGRGIVKLTMNHPKSFNALSERMIESMIAELTSVASDPNARVVVIAGAGKAFCAGHDLREMKQTPTLEYYKGLFRRCSLMMQIIYTMRQPVVCQVQGIATAAGCQLVSMCDLAVASRDAKFAVSGINYGLFCSTPAVGLSRNMSRKHAMQMLLTGDFIDAQTAMQRGLVNTVTAPEELEQEVLRLCGAIASKPAAAIGMGKELFYKQLNAASIADAYDLAEDVMARNMMHGCAQEGFQAFLEKRSPKWED